MPEDMVTITRKEYDSLQDDATWRAAYENAGVDNWSGVDFASDLYREYTNGATG